MQGALAGNAEPAERLRLYGQRFEVYAPQHYAGMAALRLGDCTAALRYWSQGGNESFVRGIPDLADEEQQGRAECRTRLVRQGEPTAPTTEPIAQGDAGEQTADADPTPRHRHRDRSSSRHRRRGRAEPPPSRPPVVERPATNSVSRRSCVRLLDAYLDGRYSDVLKLSSQRSADAAAALAHADPARRCGLQPGPARRVAGRREDRPPGRRRGAQGRSGA